MRIFNNDISSQEKIFIKIKEIKDIFEKKKEFYSGSEEKVLQIIFNNDISFVNPLFLILLLNSHSKYQEHALAINITFLSENKQIWIHRFLIQFFDYLYIELKDTQVKQDFKISDKAVAKTSKIRTYANKRGSVYYYSVYIYKNIKKLILDDDRKYGMLPIMSITDIIKKESLGATELEQDNRIDAYSKLASDKNKEDLKKVIKKLLQKLHEDDEFYIDSLSMIIFEMIDNIKRHTKDKNNIPANGYISFHQDTSKDEAPYELTITDDFEDGFLSRYKQVLKDELQRIEYDFKLLKKKVDKDIKSSYLDDIELLENDNEESDKKILNKLFNIKETFGVHQIARLSMHFGIPSLMKLLRKLDGEFSIFMHRNLRYYKIVFKHGKTNVDILKLKDKKIEGIRGTYYCIKFPKYKIKDSEIGDKTAAVRLTLKNANYQEIFKQRDVLQKQIESFDYVIYDKLVDTNDIIENRHMISSYKNFINEKPKNDKSTVSDYIRNIYRYINLHNTQDVLIVDFPTEDNKIYLHTWVEILYYKDNNDNIINIAILDEMSPSAVFIGGRNKKEFCYSNNSLSKNYNQNKDYFFKDSCSDNNNDNNQLFSTSKIFIELKVKLEKRCFFLPFELFNISGKDILKSMIKNNLEKNKVTMHVDTGQNFHINHFYKFKNIFEDSNWVSRIAFKLALKTSTDNFKMIGTNKYANSVLASMFSIKKENEKYFVLNDFEKNSLKALGRYIGKKNNFSFYSPVVFSGKKIQDDLINKDTDNWYRTIKINIDNKEKDNPFTLLNINLKNDDYEDISKSKCDICTSSEEGALYKISKDNPFTIDKFNLKNYISKNIQSYCEKNEKIIANFFGTVYFGHTVRGNNHYTYYTKTIDFFEKNYKDIKKFLEDSSLSIDENKNNIIFAPIHNTNSRFISLVNEIVFKNNATIYHFDKSNTEQNFYDIEDILIDVNESDIYFVDDEVSSAGTLRFFESLLKVINKKLSFNGIITMIDRTSPQDEITINRLFKKIKIFTKLEIKPIKTDFGDCFLCQRREEYLNMFENSVLDMTRFQIAKRITKLKSKSFDDVDYAENNDFETKLRTFIKMSAVHFAHKQFELFEDVELEENRSKKNRSIIEVYEKAENKFKIYIWDLLKINLDGTTLIKKEYFKNICYYESKIALLKSISFPKIVYFRLIREIATVVVIKRIKDIINGYCPEYIDKNDDYSKFKIVDILNADEKKEIEIDIENDGFKEFKEYLKKFKNKNGINYLNFLYRTAGYLNVSQILDEINIEFFYRMTKEFKDSDNRFNDLHHLLHTYPFAVKMITSDVDNQDKYRYFKENIEEFRKNNLVEFDNNKYSMIHALLLESGKNIKKELQNEIESWKKKNINEKINKLSKFIETEIGNSIEVKSIYINENINIEYNGGYKEYLKSSKLIDVKNNFEEFIRDNKEVYTLYQGALRSSGEFVDLDYTKDYDNKIDNTWSNMPFGENKKYFAIKLVDIDKEKLKSISYVEDVMKNTPIWFKPIGCIVISFDGSYVNHLRFSEFILSLQNEIVEFFKSEFKHQSITQMIKVKNHDDLLKSLDNISHTYGKYIEIDKKVEKLREYLNDDTKILNMVKIFSNGLAYIFETGTLEATSKKAIKNNISNRLNNNKTFFKFLQEFLKVVPYFIYDTNKTIASREKIKYTINIENLNRYNANIDKDTKDLYIIIFELIFNGINKNREKSIDFKIIVDNAIYIANTGEAIPTEKLNLIFDDGISTSKKGLGMGLYRIKKYLNPFVNIDARGQHRNLGQEYNVVFQIYNSN